MNEEIKIKQQKFFDENYIKDSDLEGWMKGYKRELADKNIVTASEYEDYRKQLEKDFFDFNMVIINFGVTNIEQHEGYPPELRTIAAEQYRVDTISLLEQLIECRAWYIDFRILLSAYKPLFEKMVLEWYKRKIVHFVNRVNDHPTDELHQSIIQDEFKAESELLINSNNPILPFYHSRLASLMVNLDKRSAIAGGFDKKHPETKGEYVLKESAIIKLYEEYGGEFPGETLPLWKQRWIDDKKELTKINTENFKLGNNKHLLLSILDTAYELKILKVNNLGDYIKTRWGMGSYYRDVSIYLKDRDAKPYPGIIKIKKILKSE